MVRVNIRTFYDDAMTQYDTIAEIPGTDKKDEVVMLGAHLDSWHTVTGATDNGAGSLVMMEAVRILKALDGEEQGLFGSQWYVFPPLRDAAGIEGSRPERGAYHYSS
jgi:carboxypeptidase Q